ncbi:Spo0E family sporulation regulatory protein-aspartic acid phosphatase [Clostridium sp. D2Q-11]|uniref:Spo0E family sporulation regulatory protein-aspartic acid phosphatase n=1 Tax=Anaeromonas frigoriresistens TaxID=2683708 RepID=A0A942Z8B2_9FIRM|nr:Spo0E family sporulation regulatory protein-aspartic acid phosphatase [Anaeromonas frigoriresistens]
MGISNKIIEINEQIQKQRQVLEYSLSENLTDANVIKVSDQMDQLIVSYYMLKKSELIG